MNPIQISKLATGFVVGLGTDTIVRGIIANNVAPATTPLARVSIAAATLVASAIATNRACDTTDRLIDRVADGIKDARDEYKKKS